MPNVLTIYGTRPEAIKMAPLIAALSEHPALSVEVAVTGQHREMLDQVNELFGIEPRHDFDIMTPGAALHELSARALSAASGLLRVEQPDAIVVQGDTSSAFVCALAAFYEQIPVIHLEAGLRTGNLQDPFPEEGNRRLIAPLSSLHLAPTTRSRQNLQAEGIAHGSICVTGNTVIDALHEAVLSPVEFRDPRIEAARAAGQRIVVVTTHRRESWGERMRGVAAGVRDLAERHEDTLFILPMHRNAIVREALEPILGASKNVLLTEPLTYHEFAHLLSSAFLVLTDSGGVQEEAPAFGIPVLVLRETTERPEAVQAGTVRLIGTNRQRIVDEASRLLTSESDYREMATAVNPYGDGYARHRAAAAIAEFFGEGVRLPDFNPPANDLSQNELPG